MKNRTVLLYMTFFFLSNFSTILYFLTVYLEFVGFSMVAISSMMIAYQVSKFILEVPTGYIADRSGRLIGLDERQAVSLASWECLDTTPPCFSSVLLCF